MGISSVDIANATANEAQRDAKDMAVLLDWIDRRLVVIEAASGIAAEPRPELPSEREQRLWREALPRRRARVMLWER